MPPSAPCVLEHLQQRLQRTLLERDRALDHHEQVPGRRHAESAEVIPRHARDRTPEAPPLSSFDVRLDRRAPRPPACGTRAPHRREPPVAPAPHAGHRPRGTAPPAPLPACHPTLPSCCSVPAHRGRTVLNPIAPLLPGTEKPRGTGAVRGCFAADTRPAARAGRCRSSPLRGLGSQSSLVVASMRTGAGPLHSSSSVVLLRLSNLSVRHVAVSLLSLLLVYLLYRHSSPGCPVCSIRCLPRRALLVASGEGDPCLRPG